MPLKRNLGDLGPLAENAGVEADLANATPIPLLLSATAENAAKDSICGTLGYSFWAMNIGLALMVVLSLLPIGLAQAVASIDHGLWYARSETFLQQPMMQALRWLRMIGDLVFISGVAALVWFVVGLETGWSIRRARPTP